MERIAPFLELWKGRGGWDKVILVEDAPERSKLTLGGLSPDHHYAHDDISRVLGDDAWIISKKDSAVRCFGFLAAYHLGADYVLTLDDDCYYPGLHPYISTLFDGHIANMETIHKRWIYSAGCRTRGLPYRSLGKLGNVVASMGLWTGSGDPDGLTSLVEPIDNFQPPKDTWIVPSCQYVPVCGMNLCIKRQALPLFYFPLMGEGQPYRRFDDIWAGVIAQKLMRHLGWHISIGEPFVHHSRASDPMANLVAEAAGIQENERFWQVIDTVELTSKASTLDLVHQLGAHLERDRLAGYYHQLGKALQVWAFAFVRKELKL